MAKQQYYGIKYPFTSTDTDNFYLDVNYTTRGKVRSQLMHLLFTPKGQRIRNPEFGTDLIKFIFSQNDSRSWSEIKESIGAEINKYISNIKLNNIDVMRSAEDMSKVFVKIDYTVKEGSSEIEDKIIAQL